MYDNVGRKLKSWSKAMLWIEIIGSVIAGLALAENTYGVSIAIAIVGVIVAIVSSLTLYGFGEIIEKLTAIERNTRTDNVKSATQSDAELKRINEIEKLRSKGLITEEEYQKSVQNQIVMSKTADKNH